MSANTPRNMPQTGTHNRKPTRERRCAAATASAPVRQLPVIPYPRESPLFKGHRGSGKAAVPSLHPPRQQPSPHRSSYPIHSTSRHQGERLCTSTMNHARTVRWGTVRGSRAGVRRFGRSRAEGCVPKGWLWRALDVGGKGSECAAHLVVSCRVFETLVSTPSTLNRTVLKRQ